MLPVTTIIDKLQEAAEWQDSMSLALIRTWLTPKQLAAPGQLILRISERGELPWLLRARVEQDGVLLFEVIQRIPPDITHAMIEEVIAEWQAKGYIDKLSIVQ